MSDDKPNTELNMLPWNKMAATLNSFSALHVNVGGSMYEQIERLYSCNLYNIGELSVMFVNMYHEANSEAERFLLEKKYQRKSNQGGETVNEDLMKFLISDLPYYHWTLPMVALQAEVRVLTQQNDYLETILEQNKPSLLVGPPDQQE
jgi:hypothetical protein